MTLLTDRAVIRLSPLDPDEDLRGFLQGLVTNDVFGPLPAWAALLSPQGKVLFDFLVWEDGTDLLLVWGEGLDFSRLPTRVPIICLNAYLQPENGHADVFLPVSVQTERAGHYTNFQGVVSAFEPCFAKRDSVAHAESLFAALASPPGPSP